MNNDIVNRIKEIMRYYDLNSLTLSKRLEYNSSEKISRLFREGNAKPSYDIIYDISNKFEINVDWLITGRGAMLEMEERKDPQDMYSTTSTMDERLFAMLRDKDFKIEDQAKLIGRLEAEIEFLQKKIPDQEGAGDAVCAAAGM